MIALGNATAAHDPDQLLDVGAVALLLRCSESHVRHQVRLGRFPRPVKLGALSRWSRDSVLQWCRTGPGRTPERGPSVERGGTTIQVR